MPSAAVDIAGSVETALDAIFAFLPNLIGFLLILLVGFFVAKLLQAIIRRVLTGVGVDRRLHETQAGTYLEKVSPGASPSNGVGRVVFYIVFIYAIVVAIGQLGIPAATAFMADVLAYLPNVIAAIAIFVVAGIIAGAVGGAVHKAMGDTPTGRILRAAAPTLVMAIAVFMILTQLEIAPEIVTATYYALIGALAIGSALAFGLGGREVARDMLQSGYERAQEEQDQVREDVQLGRERSERQAERVREREGREAGQPASEQPTRTGPEGGPYRAT